MSQNYTDILKNMISEFREKTLADIRQSDPDISAQAAHLARLSRSFQTAVGRLSPFRQRVVERYLDERGYMETQYCDRLYIQGVRDCVKLLRWLGLLDSNRI